MALKITDPKYLCAAIDCNRGRVYYDLTLDDDQRFYFDSVTTIINGTLHKGHGFDKWLGDSLSYDHAMKYAEKKALEGTITHDYIDLLIQGHEVDCTVGYYDQRSDKTHKVGDPVKKRLLGFMRFLEEHDPKFIASELPLFNPRKYKGSYNYPFAGCVDMIAEIDGELWLLDTKTGNAYEKSHELQLTAYKILWDSMYAKDYGEIKRVGSLYIGDGWRIKPTFKLKEYTFRPDVWTMVLELYKYIYQDKKSGDLENPKFKAIHPDQFKITQGEEDE